MEERLWNRRADLYARIAQVMRQHSESSVETVSEEDISLLSGLVSEAEMVGSTEAVDLLNLFAFDDPSIERRIEIWMDFQATARRELGADRLPGPG